MLDLWGAGAGCQTAVVESERRSVDDSMFDSIAPVERVVRVVCGLVAITGLIWILVLLFSESPYHIDSVLEFGPNFPEDACPPVVHEPELPYEKNTCSQVHASRLGIAVISALPTVVLASVALLYRRRAA